MWYSCFFLAYVERDLYIIAHMFKFKNPQKLRKFSKIIQIFKIFH